MVGMILMSYYSAGKIRFSGRELFDLSVAWLALGIAFTVFFWREIVIGLVLGRVPISGAATRLAVSMGTVGIGFLLHELAHKIVAIRFGRVAEFRADYGMLAVAILAGYAGFLFAAPGAVYHTGRRITARQNGLIAVAGPLTNLALAGVFLPLALMPISVGGLQFVGHLGVSVNLVLAAFNMIPLGPLDGKKVLGWNLIVFGIVFLVSVSLAIGWLFSPIGLGIGL